MFFVDYYNLRFLLPLLRVPPHSESPPTQNPPPPHAKKFPSTYSYPFVGYCNSSNDYNSILIIVVNSHLVNICYVISYMYFQSTP